MSGKTQGFNMRGTVDSSPSGRRRVGSLHDDDRVEPEEETPELGREGAEAFGMRVAAQRAQVEDGPA